MPFNRPVQQYTPPIMRRMLRLFSPNDFAQLPKKVLIFRDLDQTVDKKQENAHQSEKNFRVLESDLRSQRLGQNISKRWAI